MANASLNQACQNLMHLNAFSLLVSDQCGIYLQLVQATTASFGDSETLDSVASSVAQMALSCE